MTTSNTDAGKTLNWKNFLLFGIIVTVMVLVSLSWYKNRFSMTEAKMFEILVDSPEHQILIASQGSKYKDAIVAKLISQLEDRSIYIKVIDVSSLATVDPKGWNAIVILHTWEGWQPQADAKIFIERLGQSETQRVVVLTTSGSGDAKMDGVDAITSASVISDVETVAATIIQRLDTAISK